MPRKRARMDGDEPRLSVTSLPLCIPEECVAPHVLLFLVCLATQQPLVLLPLAQGSAIGEPVSRERDSSRRSSIQQSAPWLSILFPERFARIYAHLAGETSAGSRIVVAPVRKRVRSCDVVRHEGARAALARAGQRFAWFSLAALFSCSALYNAASFAVSRTVVFGERVAPLASLSPDLEPYAAVGARGLHAMRPTPPVTLRHGAIRIGDALAGSPEADRDLQEALMVPDDHPHAAHLHSLIDRVGVLDMADLTSDDSILSQPSPRFDDPGFGDYRFSDRPAPPVTDYVVPPRAQPYHCYDEEFDSPADLLEPACQSALESWYTLVVQDLVRIRDAPLQRSRPEPFVRGQECFVPRARGCVWDLRAAGKVVPLAFSGELDRTMDHGLAKQEFPGGWEFGAPGEQWPDQRLLSYLDYGVRFEVTLPLQIVLFPHLVSVPPGFASLQKETRRMAALDGGWMQIFVRIPYLPIRCLAHGAASRKLEKDRWRSTTEAGGPRY